MEQHDIIVIKHERHIVMDIRDGRPVRTIPALDVAALLSAGTSLEVIGRILDVPPSVLASAVGPPYRWLETRS